jgi:hypothetical protein
MKKNIVFWIGVRSQDLLLQEKHGGFKYLDISKQSWEYWCKKNDVIFYEYNSTSEQDTNAHRPTWIRWFDVFPLLESTGIDFDKILLVDGSTIIKWNAPNFFNDCSEDLTAFKALENINWVYEAIQGYKEFFNGFEFETMKYIDCGFQVFTKNHKQFLIELKDFYYGNYDRLMQLQKTVNKGTDQTIYNYLLQIKNIKVNTNLHPSFNLNHLHRFDWFNYNWQLKEDQTPYFIKYGNVWKFSGFPNRGDRFNLMSQTWDIVKHNYE